VRIGIATVVLGAALSVVGCAAASPVGTPSPSTSATTSAFAALAVGDCIGSLSAQGQAAVPQVDCAGKHNWEVAALVPSAGDVYPGEAVLRQLADTECAKAFTTYVGVEPGYSPFGATFIAPNQVHWSDPANRHIACLVGSEAGDLKGSLAGTAMSFPAQGQCLGQPVTGTFAVDLINCSQPHYYEVYATKKWTGKKAPTTAEFDKLYNTVCVSGFKEFVGLSVGKSKYEILSFIAPSSLWTKLSDHRIVCSAGSPKGAISGSLEDVKK
jgi:hypothetical protein